MPSWKKCSPFTITVKGEWEKIIKEVKRLAKENDVEFKGDATKGSFINKAKDVKGTYTISGQKITMKTEEKMWIGTCADVQTEFHKWFKGK